MVEKLEYGSRPAGRIVLRLHYGSSRCTVGQQ